MGYPLTACTLRTTMNPHAPLHADQDDTGYPRPLHGMALGGPLLPGAAQGPAPSPTRPGDGHRSPRRGTGANRGDYQEESPCHAPAATGDRRPPNTPPYCR
jgi:hypothetical protein